MSSKKIRLYSNLMSKFQINVPERKFLPVESYTREFNANLIIPNLYLGSYDSLRNVDELKSRKITHILGVAHECEIPDYIKTDKLFVVMHISLRDSSEENIEMYFNQTSNFIESAFARDEAVLVFCRMGVSRSASFVIAFLITHGKLNYEDAFDLVKSKRNCVSPNLGFCLQLRSL